MTRAFAARLLVLLPVSVASVSPGRAQVAWTENFNNGCSSNCDASTYGGWTILDNVGGVTAGAPNNWFVSCAEEGISPPGCGSACVGDQSLHIGANAGAGGDMGASYNDTGANNATFRMAVSPTIDLTSLSSAKIEFDFIAFGSFDCSEDRAQLRLSADGGATWPATYQYCLTSLCCGSCNGYSQGQWTRFSQLLPAAFANNPNVRVGFHWLNNGNGAQTDPSVAIDDIRIGRPDGPLITKSDGVGTVVAGTTVTYVMDASAADYSIATGGLPATIQDTFPPTLSGCSTTCTKTGTALAGQCLSSTVLGDLNHPVTLPIGYFGGGVVTLTSVCALDPGAAGTLSNSVSISASGYPTYTATDVDTIVAQANLAITKTDGVTVATPGGSTTYTIVASNAGPSHAPGSVVADTPPSDCATFTWTCAGAGGGTCTAAGSALINDTVFLPVGGSVTYTAICGIDTGATGTLVNTATVTAAAGVTDLVPGNNSATDTDGLTAAVGNRVWLDTDGDGVQDVGETGINGVTVELLDSGASVIGTNTTAGNGNYTFASLAAGTYSVRIVAATLPAGLTPTYDLDGIATSHLAVFSLALGQNRTDVDFGYRGTGSAGDRLWLDANGNGVQDSGETGLNGVTVELLDSGNTVVATNTTSGDGNYTFGNLSAGTQSARVVAATLPAGLAATFDLDGTATPNTATFSLAGGQTRTDVDFGYGGTASVGDRLWLDANGNGVQDSGEVGINGATVELLDSGNSVVATGTTSGDGNYTFANLTAGTYSVGVVAATLPVGLAQTYDLDGIATAHAATFTLAGGQARTDVDFGYRALADLAITKTDGVTTATPGGSTVYTIVASNAGPSVAPGSLVADTPPAACTTYNWTCTGTGGGTCTAAGSATINDTVNLPVGASVTYSATCAIAAGANGSLANTATVAGAAGVADPSPGSNTATDTDALAPEHDVALTMTVDDATPALLQTVTFTVTATNNGPSAASGVAVTDVLPPGLAYASHLAPGTTYTPATGIWAVGALAPGASLALQLTATANRIETLFNQATVTAALGLDRDPSNNASTVGLNAIPYADIQVQLAVDDATPASGDTVILTLTATNASTSVATGVQLTDQLLGGLNWVSDDSGGSYTPGNGHWQVGTLAGGATATLHITASVGTGATISNLATKTGQAELDPNAGNDSASVTLNPSGEADLSLAKLASQEPVALGASFAYVIVVTNHGPSTATGVTVVDDLSTVGVTLDSTSPSGICTGSPVLTCALGAIPPGGSAAIMLSVTKNTGGTITNVASVSGVESDPNLANNSNGDGTTPVRLLSLTVE